MKKLISLILSFLMLFSLVSCVPEETPQETAEEGYVYSGTLENGGRWFYAEMSYSNLVKPLDGTYEKERTDSVYINSTLTNGEKRQGFSAGTIVKIEYDGEIFLPSGQEIPIITNIYSVAFEPYPFVSGKVTYLVSCTQAAFEGDEIADLCINRKNGDEHVHAPYLLKAENVEQLRDLYLKMLHLDYFDCKFGYYTDEFFKDNILLLAVFSSGSGGDRYKLDSIVLADGTLEIGIVQTQSGQTCDLSQWLICVSVPRDTAKEINEYEAVNGWRT